MPLHGVEDSGLVSGERHFGAIPSVTVGAIFADRRDLGDATPCAGALHRPAESGLPSAALPLREAKSDSSMRLLVARHASFDGPVLAKRRARQPDATDQISPDAPLETTNFPWLSTTWFPWESTT